MNVAVGRLYRRAKLVLLAGVLVAGGLVVPGTAQAQPKQPDLAFRAFASTTDAKDKDAVKAWKDVIAKGKDDPKVAQKLDKAAADNVPPAALLTPRTEGDKKNDPARYRFLRISADDLIQLGVDVTSKADKDKKTNDLLTKGRTKKEAVEVPDKDVLVYSWKGPDGEPRYGILARPESDEGKINGKHVERVQALPDKKNRYWGVLVKLNKDGGKQFETFTKENQKHYLVILVGNRIVHIAKLGGPIAGGELEISGNLDYSRARRIQAGIESCIAPKERSAEDK